MESLNQKLGRLASKVQSGERIHIAIFGLGSVGHYLMEYLLALRDPGLKLYVAGRSSEKLVRDVNISRVSGLIRGPIASEVEIVEADLNSIESIEAAVARIQPDFLVNSSRAYSGVKYGGISWTAIRAYGLWAPLSVKYIKNIMQACARTASPAIVINTSYADATNAWLKSAGMAYPDFGSGNINHLVPRIKLAIALSLGLSNPSDLGDIDVTLATSHFHDVAISKEGTTEGVEPLLHVEYRGRAVQFDARRIYGQCAIGMPVDQKRNMMNASSNFEIIFKLLQAVRSGAFQKLHAPGVGGLVGGYPFFVQRDAGGARGFSSGVLESVFTLAQMTGHNRKSIYLDGIADVRDGTLFYTPELAEKVRKAFNFKVPPSVSLDASDGVAADLIDQIISKRK